MDVTMVNPQVTECDLAWLAGFWDGEGTFTISPSNNGRTLTGCASVGNTDWGVMEHVAKILDSLDVTCQVTSFQPTRANSKHMVKIKVARISMVHKFVSLLLPYLHCKHGQAGLLLRFVSSRLGKGNYHPYTEDEQLACQQIRMLNHRGTSETTREPSSNLDEDIVHALGNG